MPTEKISQLEKDIVGVKSEVHGLSGEVQEFKDMMRGTLDKIADSMHDLAIAINESKFRDENLKTYVEQNHKHMLEKQENISKSVSALTTELSTAKNTISEIQTQQALNNRSIGDARRIFLGVISAVVISGVLIWLGFK